VIERENGQLTTRFEADLRLYGLFVDNSETASRVRRILRIPVA